MQQPEERQTLRQTLSLVFDDLRYEAVEPDWRYIAKRLQARRWRQIHQAERAQHLQPIR